MGNLFTTPPDLDHVHQALAQKSVKVQSPRPIIGAFYRYQARERVLRWPRQNDVVYKGNTLRFYPDHSTNLSKKHAAFKNIKAAFYRKGIQFRLLYSARLQVSYGGETLIFETPADAETFYSQQVEGSINILASSEQED